MPGAGGCGAAREARGTETARGRDPNMPVVGRARAPSSPVRDVGGEWSEDAATAPRRRRDGSETRAGGGARREREDRRRSDNGKAKGCAGDARPRGRGARSSAERSAKREVCIRDFSIWLWVCLLYV